MICQYIQLFILLSLIQLTALFPLPIQANTKKDIFKVVGLGTQQKALKNAEL